MNAPKLVALRAATLDDIAVMTRIYAHHVLQGTGSFEELPPTDDEMLQRWQLREADGYPTLIAETEGQVSGFAYAGNYKPRSAYRFTVEDSIYIDPEFLGQGVGKAMLLRLIDICQRGGYQQMMAVIGDSANLSSIRLHESCGFAHVGVAKALGYKHGKWLDVVYMQRSLHERGAN